MVARKVIVIEDKRREPVAAGYLPSGESAFSTRAAHGYKVDTISRDRSNISRSRLDLMVTHERAVVARLERRAQEARDNPDPNFPPGRSPTFLGIVSRLWRTREFLARLEAEQREITP